MESRDPESPNDQRKREPLAVFPLVPDSIRSSSFIPYELGAFQEQADVEQLILSMWHRPECIHYYYFPVGGSVDGCLGAARESGSIQMNEMERRYFKLPEGRANYVRIREGQPAQFDWMKEIVKTAEYWKVTLGLGPRKKDELDTIRKIELEEELRRLRTQSAYAYDVFLSYSEADRGPAEVIRHKLDAAGVRVFIAPKSISPGDNFVEEIRLAILGAAEMWLLVSESSAKSEWVTTERGAAWVLGKTIIPVLYRCGPAALPDRMRNLQCVDLHEIDEVIRSKAAELGRAPGS